MDSAALLEEAARLHRQGALAEAADRYERALQGDPRNADALYSLAQIACQRGQFAQGVDLIRRALTVAPRSARSHVLLGRALLELGAPQDALASFDRAIGCQDDLADAYGNRGDVLAQLGRLPEAVESYQRALTYDPSSVANWCNLGAVQIDLGRIGEALAAYDRLVALEPGFAEAHFNRGNALMLLGRDQEAVAAYDGALGVNPNYPDALNNRGNALRRLGRAEEALASFERALALVPDHVAVLVSHGDTLRDLDRQADALRSYERALAVTPGEVGALMGRGAALMALKRPEEALQSIEAGLAIDPSNADGWSNRAFLLQSLNRHDEALASLDRALTIDARHLAALLNRGVLLSDLGRHADAIASYDRVIAISPAHVVAHCNRAKGLFALDRLGEALAGAERALAIEPAHVETLFTRGNVLTRMRRYGDAIGVFERVLALDPRHPHALAQLAGCCLWICDWEKLGAIARPLAEALEAGTAIAAPHTLLQLSLSPSVVLEATRRYLQREIPAGPKLVATQPGASTRDKIRVAYLSGDYRVHPVAYLAAELFERHDRDRFELIGVSFGPDDGSSLRARIVKSFDRFHDVRTMGDRDAAALLRQLGVDIAVDLGGHTDNARPGILQYRPAPIAVNYLGFAGTMGADFVDYIVADRIVLPFDQQPYYLEKIVHLPHCFLVNDATKAISSTIPSRSEAGLPERGFVFCCFNNSYKFSAAAFQVWLRLLSKVEGSVLWLSQPDPRATDNLQAAARAGGVDPGRIVFAPRMPSMAGHLARHRLADLFLDTPGYNAHTTASDALWAGLPVLTCIGPTFAGRVAASLLHAVGLPELVTQSLEDYEALALTLASDPARLTAIRHTLEQNRLTHPLFDTDRFRRDIERAYRTMWDIRRQGRDPRSFSVEPGEA